MHLSHVPQAILFGFFGDIDVVFSVYDHRNDGLDRKISYIVFANNEWSGPVHLPIKGGVTNWDVFMDPAQSKYYLLDEKTWLKAKELSGPWVITTQLPADM